MFAGLHDCRRDIKLKVYDFQFEGDSKVQTKWRFSCVLNLPWKPLLAAAGQLQKRPALMYCSVIDLP